MTPAECGCYIRILCHLADKGRISEANIKVICGENGLTKTLSDKFRIDSEGFYYNERLVMEVDRRKNYTQSRRINAQNEKAYAKHMENVNENVISNTTKQQEEKIQFKEYVVMTQGQYDQLAEKLGKSVLNEYVERLNNYIGSQGKKYKSHYHTILSWTAKDNGKSISASKPTDNRDMWEKKASKSCTNCRGTGAIYAPGSGQYAKCGCVH